MRPIMICLALDAIFLPLYGYLSYKAYCANDKKKFVVNCLGITVWTVLTITDLCIIHM